MGAASNSAAGAGSPRGLVGREYGAVYAWDPVNQPMIRHWCEATGNTNPLYGGTAAPPSMLQAWLFPGYGGQHPPGSATEGPQEVFDLLANLGFTATIGVNSEQRYLRYLRPGDQLHCRARLAAVSEEKHTALGAGHFVTIDYRYFDQNEELVGIMSFRQLAYRPPAPAAVTHAAAAPAAAVVVLADDPAAQDPPALHCKAPGCRGRADLKLGDELAPMLVPLTVGGIIAAAIATRDYHPAHHDVDAVRALGMPSIFMNILTTNAYVERYVTEWAGPGAQLSALNIKLGTPLYAGDCLRLSGVVGTTGAGEECWVEINISGTNARGVHVSGTARLMLA
jgi:acyl dehydratase